MFHGTHHFTNITYNRIKYLHFSKTMDIVNKNGIVHITYGTFEKPIVVKKKTTKYSPKFSTMYPTKYLTKYPKLYYVGYTMSK